MAPKKKDDKLKEEADAQALPVEDSGTFVFENGARYCGQFVRREAGVIRRNGQGTYSEGFFNYEGQWKDDSMSGDAHVTFASGASYVGTVLDGKFDGKGTYKWPDGSVYVGQWRFNRVHGEGTYTDPDGQSWTGRFYNGTGPGLQLRAAELAHAAAAAKVAKPTA